MIFSNTKGQAHPSRDPFLRRSACKRYERSFPLLLGNGIVQPDCAAVGTSFQLDSSTLKSEQVFTIKAAILDKLVIFCVRATPHNSHGPELRRT